MSPTRKKRGHPTVFVGLSGGVDSAVSAALLQQQGYRVVGVFLESWSETFAPSACTQADDRRDAARIAAKLNIPFLVMPCAEQYRERVLRAYLVGLQRGETPNPDALCNSEIKFHLFLDAALAAGADYVATGHYARLISKWDTAQPRLHKAVDADKDQSYFLSRVPAQAFQRVLFPVGHLQKTEVRRLARKLQLPVAEKPDSQGLCFVGRISLPSFLQSLIRTEPGDIRLNNGRLIGHHQGLAFYTIGQRHGFGAGYTKPVYVARKDLPTNTLYVSDDRADLQNPTVTIQSWLAHADLLDGPGLTAKLRYRQPDQSVRQIERTRDTVSRLIFEQPQTAATPGQVAVLYRGDRLVGSGIII